MHKLYLALVFVCIFFGSVFVSQDSYAISQGVISQIQTKSLVTGGSASEELIEVYNNSDSDIDVTGWCLKYGSAGNLTPTKTLVCINSNTLIKGLHIFLPKRSSAVFVSQAFVDQNPKFGFDKLMSSGMADNNDRWVSLMDGIIILDTLGWGKDSTPSTAEGGVAATIPPAFQLLQRKMVTPDVLQDTENNSNDFVPSPARTVYSYGALYDMQDVCFNIDGIQEVPPTGDVVDSKGDCGLPIVDVCLNIKEIQTIIPSGYQSDGNDNCVIDICLNLDGLQVTLPDKYTIVDGKCMKDILPLTVTELLPNAIGDDGGSEFIEIYNPNNVEVCLSDYLLSIGTNNTKYSFPTGNCIGAGEYMAFYNNVIKFTLLNTTSVVRLLGTDDILIDESLAYNDPDDGVAWALIDDIWQYTNQPAPGGANLPSLVASNASITTVSTSILKPCKDGQYRSEETNRCRSIASDVNILVPCAEGEERNPDTNRCRSITAVLGASDLVPCKTGQERNPDTNRCRNIVGAMPKADYAPKQTASNSNNYIIWLSLAVVGMVAVGYGIWEWRQEINNGRLKLLSFLKHRK